MPAQRVRLALSHKGVPHRAISLGQGDDATFFELGVARCPLVLRLENGAIHTDSRGILEGLDGWLGGPPLFEGVIQPDAWAALWQWRNSVENVLARLYAPVLPAFLDIAENENTLAAYKAGVERRFGMSVEALSNDRYDGFQQFSGLSRLRDLGRHLAQERFYVGGRLSAADLVLASDLFPLQLLDGVTVPLDLMYYIQRVEEACGASLRDGLATQH